MLYDNTHSEAINKNSSDHPPVFADFKLHGVPMKTFFVEHGPKYYSSCFAFPIPVPVAAPNPSSNTKPNNNSTRSVRWVVYISDVSRIAPATYAGLLALPGTIDNDIGADNTPMTDDTTDETGKDDTNVPNHIELLIIDMLGDVEYPSHFSTQQALEAAQKINARRTRFVGMGHGLDYHATNARIQKVLEKRSEPPADQCTVSRDWMLARDGEVVFDYFASVPCKL